MLSKGSTSSVTGSRGAGGRRICVPRPVRFRYDGFMGNVPNGCRLFVLLPIFNEEETLDEILGRVSRHADGMILVDDGSSDSTPRILERFSKTRRGVFVLRLPTNRGMAGALLAGFQFALFLMDRGEASPDDVLGMMDADGQHRPEYLPEGKRLLVERGLDVLLTRRDFSVYPRYKILGNRFLTFTNRLLSGFPYQDVESGMRYLRLGAVPSILKYYRGRGYSCAQEIALLSVRQGLKVANDFLVEVPRYRAGTTLWDGFNVLFQSLGAFFRWRLDRPVRRTEEAALFLRAWEDSKRSWKS